MRIVGLLREKVLHCQEMTLPIDPGAKGDPLSTCTLGLSRAIVTSQAKPSGKAWLA